MRANEVRTTGRKHAGGRLTSGDVAGAPRVLTAAWCRSVGATWTLELHELDGGPARRTIVDWISSGVPISQPEPEVLALELLAKRGLQLFHDSSAGPGTHSRTGVGYVCGDAELISLARLVRDDAAKMGGHPVALAAQWVAAGFSADAAARWIRQGVHSPHATQHQTVSSQLTVKSTHAVGDSGPPAAIP